MKRLWLGLALLLLVPSLAFAGNVLIQNFPWGSNGYNEADMAAAVGTYTEYDFTVPASSVFNTSTCCFVFMDGGDGTQSEFEAYLTANSSTILNWVSNGGALLLQTAGWNTPSTFTFANGTFTLDYGYTLSPSGTLTAAGISAFGVPANQSGSYLAHDYISVTGSPTVFMVSDNDGVSAIVAGEKYGNGYIMFSGLTDSEFHSLGAGLNVGMIAYTASQANCATPEPGTLVMLASGMLGLAGVVRRKIKI